MIVSQTLPVRYRDGRYALAVRLNTINRSAILVFLHNAFKLVHRPKDTEPVEKILAAANEYSRATFDDLFPGLTQLSLLVNGVTLVPESVIRRAFNCCDATIYNWRRLRDFPAPQHFNLHNYYPLGAVVSWIASQSMLI